jgi:LacI family transcriptional regulator
VIIADIANPFFTALVRGVEDVAAPAGFSVVLCNTDNDEAKEGRYVTAALTEQLAGVVISPTPGSPHVARLLDAGVPEKDAAGKLGMPPWLAKKTLSKARDLDRETLERAICAVADLELDLRGEADLDDASAFSLALARAAG